MGLAIAAFVAEQGIRDGIGCPALADEAFTIALPGSIRRTAGADVDVGSFAGEGDRARAADPPTSAPVIGAPPFEPSRSPVAALAAIRQGPHGG